MVKTGEAIPVFYDAGDADGTAPVPKSMAGVDVPSFPQLYAKVKGKPPGGQLWEAYRTLFEVNSTLQRLVALPPGAPTEARDALRHAVAELNDDPAFATEALKSIQFAPEYVTGPDTGGFAAVKRFAFIRLQQSLVDFLAIGHNGEPSRL